MKRHGFAHFLGVLVLLSGCVVDPKVPPGKEIELETTTFSFDQEIYPTSSELFPNYRLAPGDVLDVLFQIRTWQQKEEFRLAVDHTISVKFINSPNLNETQLVQPDGIISLPYVGEVYVVNKSIKELTKELQDKYRTILRYPELYIIVPEFRSGIKELKKDLHTAPRGLSRLVTIRPDGYVTFPLAGEFFVADKTIPEVNEILNKVYDDLHPGLHVDLFLEEHSGALVYVMGEVAKPGAFKIQRPITIPNAITLAAGHTRFAALENVIVFRRHEKKIVGTSIDLRSTLSVEEKANFFYLKPDDILYLPKRNLASIGDIMEDVGRVLLFRGWSIGLDGQLYVNPLIDR